MPDTSDDRWRDYWRRRRMLRSAVIAWLVSLPGGMLLAMLVSRWESLHGLAIGLFVGAGCLLFVWLAIAYLWLGAYLCPDCGKSFDFHSWKGGLPEGRCKHCGVKAGPRE